MWFFQLYVNGRVIVDFVRMRVFCFFGLELSICYHDWSVAEGDHVLIQTPLFRVVLVFTSLHLHFRSTEVCFKSNFIHHSSKNKQEHKTIAWDEPLEKWLGGEEVGKKPNKILQASGNLESTRKIIRAKEKAKKSNAPVRKCPVQTVGEKLMQTENTLQSSPPWGKV